MSETIEFPSVFQAQATSFDNQSVPKRVISESIFSKNEAIDCAQLIEMADGEGTIMYYPKIVTLDIGDVLFLRERPAIDDNDTTSKRNGELPVQLENGVVVQI